MGMAEKVTVWVIAPKVAVRVMAPAAVGMTGVETVPATLVERVQGLVKQAERVAEPAVTAKVMEAPLTGVTPSASRSWRVKGDVAVLPA